MVAVSGESNIRRRRGDGGRQLTSSKKKAAALFRLWHQARQLVDLAERLGDSELVHLLGVTQLLIEERAAVVSSGGRAFGEVDPDLPN